MTVSEFKAWFEGFTETLEGPPNQKQWDRIKARVKEVDGVATTYPVYVERYRPYYGGPYWSTMRIGGTNTTTVSGVDCATTNCVAYNSHDALRVAGRNEFSEVN